MLRLTAFDAGDGTKLLKAADTGDLQGLTDLLAAHVYGGVRNQSGFTPLILAASKNHVKLCEALLPHSRLNAKCFRGGTALTYAAAAGSLEAVRLLLEAKARVAEPTELLDGRPVPHCPPLVEAAARGKSEIVRLLLDGKASPDSFSIHKLVRGQPALRVAAAAGHVETAKMLVEARADVNLDASRGTLFVLLRASFLLVSFVELRLVFVNATSVS